MSAKAFLDIINSNIDIAKPAHVKWAQAWQEIVERVQHAPLNKEEADSLLFWLANRGMTPGKPPKNMKSWIRIKKRIQGFNDEFERVQARAKARIEREEALRAQEEAARRKAEAARKAEELRKKSRSAAEEREARRQRLIMAAGGIRGLRRLLKAAGKVRASKEAILELADAKAEVKELRRKWDRGLAITRAYDRLNRAQRRVAAERRETLKEQWVEIVISTHDFGDNPVAEEAVRHELLGEPMEFPVRYYDRDTEKHLKKIKMLIDAGPEEVLSIARKAVADHDAAKARREKARLEKSRQAKVRDFLSREDWDKLAQFTKRARK